MRRKAHCIAVKAMENVWIIRIPGCHQKNQQSPILSGNIWGFPHSNCSIGRPTLMFFEECWNFIHHFKSAYHAIAAPLDETTRNLVLKPRTSTKTWWKTM